MQPVIIKGFMGEPAVLNYIEYDKYSVTVVGKSGETQMKLKNKYIYQYDSEGLRKLREAFGSEDRVRLEKEWQKAKPISLT